MSRFVAAFVVFLVLGFMAIGFGMLISAAFRFVAEFTGAVPLMFGITVIVALAWTVAFMREDRRKR